MQMLFCDYLAELWNLLFPTFCNALSSNIAQYVIWHMLFLEMYN